MEKTPLSEVFFFSLPKFSIKIKIEGKRDFMITIYGKYTNAVVYTTENEQYAMDEYARRQLQMICDHPSAAGSKIRVMPDVHPGKVGTIGLTMTVGRASRQCSRRRRSQKDMP